MLCDKIVINYYVYTYIYIYVCVYSNNIASTGIMQQKWNVCGSCWYQEVESKIFEEYEYKGILKDT